MNGPNVGPQVLAVALSLAVWALIYWLATERGGFSNRAARYLGGLLAFIMFFFMEFLAYKTGGTS